MSDSNKIKDFIDDSKRSDIAVLMPSATESEWEFRPTTTSDGGERPSRITVLLLEPNELEHHRELAEVVCSEYSLQIVDKGVVVVLLVAVIVL